MIQNMILNENEITVLKALSKEMSECTGGEFGYLSDVKHPFTKHQFAGYVSDFTKKGYFKFLDQSDEVYKGQFALLDDLFEAYKE